MPFHVEALYCTRTLLCHPILCWWIRILIARDNRKSWEPWFCQNALILHFLEEWFVFNQHGWVYRVILTQKYLFLPLLWKPMCFVTFWLNMWAWRHRKNILMLRSDKISQMEIFHCTYWWLSMLDVEFYRLYHVFWARNLMPWFSHDFCHFHKSLQCFLLFSPCFSTVPKNYHTAWHCIRSKPRYAWLLKQHSSDKLSAFTKHSFLSLWLRKKSVA